MKYSLILGYIGAFLGFLLGTFDILIVFFFMNPIVIFGLLGFIVFPVTGLLAIYLDSKDVNMASALFLISGLGIIITGDQLGIISSVLFIIAALLEFKDKNKISFADSDQKINGLLFRLSLFY